MSGYYDWAKVDVSANLTGVGDFLKSLGSPEHALAKTILYVDSIEQVDLDSAYKNFSFSSVRLNDQWVDVRAKRDNLLSETDWTQLSDSPVDRVAFATYRQGLRDIPQNQTDPFNIVWPVKPA